MPLAIGVFRLFISSTFSDFHEEREALQRRVFPQLEAYCQGRGATFQAVDLRWGITEDAQRQHYTMRICLEEVRRCQQLSPKPNFAVLLGDRYGWEPPPARIPADQWKRLIGAATAADRRLIATSYRGPDRNAVPPLWHLKERSGGYAEAAEHEEAVRDALRRTADAADFRGADRVPYFASATHQEIVLGALDPHYAQDASDHVHVYVRHIEGLPQDASARHFLDWDPAAQQPLPGARERLRSLETELRARLPGKVCDMHARWSQGRTDASHIDAFCAQFLEDQKKLIDQELARLDGADAAAGRPGQIHAEFARERGQHFIGRKPLLRRIERYIARPGKATPLILHGAGGLGKSALMARAWDHASAAPVGILCARFIGGVPGSESLYDLLAGVIAEIAQARGEDTPPAPADIAAAREMFLQTLQASTAQRPLVLFLDAVDQLDRADGAWQLEWLPRVLSPHTRVVISTREGPSLAAARWRFPRSLVQIAPMTLSEGRQLLHTWLASRQEAHYNAGIAPAQGRRLTVRQRKQVLDTFATTGKPLWLKLAYEEARTWASWDPPRSLPDSVEGMVQDLITRRLLEGEKHPPAFTGRALAYLTAGRFGLSDAELGQALAGDAQVRDEFCAQSEKTGQRWEQADSLPAILWSRLYFDLQPYLTQMQIDGALLYRWFHREFAEEIAKVHLGTPGQRDAIHGHLAGVFARRAPQGADLFRYTQSDTGVQVAAMRRVMEQPWQLAVARRGAELETLLTDFGFCMGKCAANRADDLIADFSATRHIAAKSAGLRAWQSLITSQGHLLRRGASAWPAHRIFLQVALEHAADSAATLAAQAWLRHGLCDWPRLQRVNRPQHLRHDGCQAVFEGHTGRIDGAVLLDSATLLTWSRDGTLRTWDHDSGSPRETFKGHTKAVCGAVVLPGGEILSWSRDRTLAVWAARTGTRLRVLRGHRGPVQGVLLLAPNRALSWSDDGTLRIWDLERGTAVEILQAHVRAVSGVQTVPGGRLLSWSARDRSVRLWEYDGGCASRVLASPRGEVGGALWLGQERVLIWSGGFPDRSRSHGDRTLSLCDAASGQALWTVTAHRQDIIDMTVLSDTSLLTWSRDGTLARWDASDGRLMHRFKGHEYWVMGAIEINPSTFVTWSQDDTIRAWNLQDGTHVLIDEVARPVSSGCRLDEHRFAIWGDGVTVWDLRDLAHPLRLEGHAQSITDVLPLPGGQILTWAVDETLRRWDPAQVEAAGDVRPPVAGKAYPAQAGMQAPGHAEWVRGAMALGTGEIASWSYDHSVRIWNPQSGLTRWILSGHRFWVMGVVELPGSRLASWSFDCDVMVWDLASGRRIATLEGSRRQEAKRAWHDALTHDHWVNGLVVVNPHSLASWAEDCTLRIWDLETLQERHVIVLESVPSDVARLDADTVCAWWEEDSAVQSWSVGTGQPTGTMTGEEFVHAHPAHREWIAETGDEKAVVLTTPDYETSVSEGALRLAHRKLGDLYWHSGRTLKLHCLADGETICASPTEKDLAFVRLEAPQMPATSD